MKSPRCHPSPWSRALLDAYRECVAPGEGLLLAVSGGLDSTALLVATCELRDELRVRVEVACLDHGLRVEAPSEVARVRALGEALGVRVHTERLAVERAGNLEAAARRARYAALEGIRVRAGLDWIVTAHTASDQAETLLMRLVRGAALRGARGIHPRRGRILRPLLRVTRSSARAFLSLRGVPFVHDPMNQDPRFVRSRVRHELMPQLLSLGGDEVELRLSRFAELASADEAALEAKAEIEARRLSLARGVLDATGLRALEAPVRRRVLRRLLEGQGILCSLDLLAAVEDALARGGRTPLPGRGELACEGGMVRCRASSEEAPCLPPLLLTREPLNFGRWELCLREHVGAAPGFFWPLPHPGRWAVRTRQPGERVTHEGRFQRLQDVFIEERVPREARQKWPLVCELGSDVVSWVVGLSCRNDGTAKGPGVFARDILDDGERS